MTKVFLCSSIIYMVKIRVTYDVEVTKSAKKLYPNFHFNFENIEQMARAVAIAMGTTELDTEKFGYKVTLVDLTKLEG